MTDSQHEFFSPKDLHNLRKKWGEPDSKRNYTWEYDGLYSEHSFMSYNNEMKEGLELFGCKTFDNLVTNLNTNLGQKPNVIDLMGGAYFLGNPEDTESLTGIRIHDKDPDFIEAAKKTNNVHSRILQKIISSPNRRIIEADVLSNDGWNKIHRAQIPPADLLVCRPIGPFDSRNVTSASHSRMENEKKYAGLYSSLFNRMLNLSNRDTGLIFTETPDIFTDAHLQEFFQKVDNEQHSHTSLFTVPDTDYHWGGYKRRYAVIKFDQHI